MCSAPHDDEARLDAPAPTGLVEHRDMECIATQRAAARRSEDAGVGDEHREVAVPVDFDVEGWVRRWFKRVQRRDREFGDVVLLPAVEKWRGDGNRKELLGDDRAYREVRRRATGGAGQGHRHPPKQHAVGYREFLQRENRSLVEVQCGNAMTEFPGVRRSMRCARPDPEAREILVIRSRQELEAGA